MKESIEPMDEHSEPSRVPTSAEPSSAAQRPDIKLLVVEDDVFMQLTMKMMLESIAEIIDVNAPEQSSPPPPGPMKSQIRIAVEFAGSGENGWELLRSGAFDVRTPPAPAQDILHPMPIALIDIHLPGVSGLDLSWCYQQMLLTGDAVIGKGRPSDEWTSLSRQTILIACTGDQSADTEQLQSYGIRDVLLKPISPRALRHILHKWLPRDGRELDEKQQLAQSGMLQPNRPGTPNVRVLLVEDDEITRTATDLVFCQFGLNIDSCTSGEQAIELLEKRDFDLILVDVNLPNMSGYALASWYKDMCRQSGRPAGYVVAVTAEPDAEACAEFQIDSCLPKPLSTACVAEALQSYWVKRKANASAESMVTDA